MLSIPLRDDLPHFDLQVTLEDVTYTLELRWNVRAGRWFMHIWDEQRITPLEMGIAVVVDWPLAGYVPGHQPPGALIFRDTAGDGIEPGAPGSGDLGGRVQLFYITAAELATGLLET